MEEKKKMNWSVLERWGWGCDCGEWNEMNTRPIPGLILICWDCDNEYEAREES